MPSNFRIVPFKDGDPLPKSAEKHAPALYNFILDFVSTHGHMPTRKVMMEGIGLSSFDKFYARLRVLKRDGLIDYTPNKADTHLVKDDPWRRIERLQRYVRALEYRIGVEDSPDERARANEEVIRAQDALQERDL